MRSNPKLLKIAKAKYCKRPSSKKHPFGKLKVRSAAPPRLPSRPPFAALAGTRTNRGARPAVKRGLL
jgi:hypothetical protein